MSKVLTDNANYSAIADAIRDKGVEGSFKPIEMADAIEQIEGGVTPTGEIDITENGTYDVTEYADAVVNVETAEEDNDLYKFLSGTLTYCKFNGTVKGLNGNSQYYSTGWKNAVYVSLKNTAGYHLGDNDFRNAQNLKFLRINAEITNNGFTNYCFANTFSLLTVVVNFTTKFTVTASAFVSSRFLTGQTILYVPDLASDGSSLPTYYKSATNWSTIGDQIKGYSEAPSYDDTTTWVIGNVCQYNGKFYSYCKKDFASATGIAPSGTTDDTDYWEYIADIEV